MSSRFRFADFSFERSDTGGCSVIVTLQKPQGAKVAGVAHEGHMDQQLRCAAMATLGALAQAIDGAVTFELLGIKAIKAFDATVIIVAISARQGDHVQRLVGSCLAAEHAQRGAAIAVLNATNRFLGPSVRDH